MTHNEQLAINSAITQLAEQHNNICSTIDESAEITNINISMFERSIMAKASIQMSLTVHIPVKQSTPNSGPI